MRILVVAFATSIHTVRWLRQISDQGWDLHLFPSDDLGAVHPKLENVTVYNSFYGQPKIRLINVKIKGINTISRKPAWVARYILKEYFPQFRAKQLARLIEKLKPDVIHSMEMQAAGYLTLAAKNFCKGTFPPWIVTNWGSDIYLFGRLQEHRPKITELLANCDYYSCESERDVKLARQYGFSGKVFPVFPNSGGFDLQRVRQLRSSGKTSQRRFIMLKGYQGWAGRALVAIRALERSADILQGYSIIIYSHDKDTVLAAELLSERTGLSIEIIPRGTDHNTILKFHGKARISIGLSISDGISTSLLEAMVMGSFPIQSNTASADEWIEDGKSGFIVPPEDPEEIEKAIRIAISDDELVDKAAAINWDTAESRLDQNNIKTQIIDIYKSIVG